MVLPPTQENLFGGAQPPSILLSSIKQNKGIEMKGNYNAKHFLKPSLIESQLTNSPDTFNSLSEGFKRIFLDNTGSLKATMGINGAKDLKGPQAIRGNLTSVG
jgi:hypothetical protein